MKTEKLRTAFNRTFQDNGEPRFFYAPGRVNLIGEHIDYNGGYVFPCALTLGTYAAIAPRKDNTMRLVSANIEPPVSLSNDDLSFDPAHGWANNPKAVTKLLMDMGHKLRGYDLYVWGNLPHNAGLSSSASINVLVATALNTIFGLGLTPVEIALLCQRAENEYLGVNCGIMDQFASAMGRKNHAILLDCNTLEYKHVPLELGDYRLVLANTNKPRALVDSKYNERRAECEYALKLLQKYCDIKNLCDLSIDTKFYENCNLAFGAEAVKMGWRVYTEAQLPPESRTTPTTTQEEIAYKRAYHAVTENDRVKSATEALSRGDLRSFAAAMNGSHFSLRDFYEVTGHELDSLVYAAHDFAAVEELDEDGIPLPPTIMLGSRMTGAGFGGCTVSIVHKDSVDDFIREVGEGYTRLTGLTADFYVAETDDGAREVF